MRLSHLLPCLLVPLSLCLAAGAAHALPEIPTLPPAVSPVFVDGPVGLSPAQASVFKDALAALVQQGHTCIVAEGSPFHLTLKLDKSPTVPDHTPLETAVKAVADAYDYDEQRQGNVFTLTKRYTDPADMPSVTLEECTTAAEYAANLLGLYAPPPAATGPKADPGWDQINSVLSTLSPDQAQAIFSKKGLPVSSLSSDQRAAVDRWDTGILLDGPHLDAQRFLVKLQQAPKCQVGMGDIAVNADGHGTVTVFGRRGPDPRDPVSTDRVFFTTFEDGVRFLGDKLDDQSGGPVTQDELTAARARREGEKADGHETLAQAVAGLNSRGAHFQVLDALAAKTVMVAGDAEAAPAAVLDGLAAVYGLRVYRRDDGVTELTHMERVTSLDLSAMHDALLRALPAPLLRAAHFADAQAATVRNATLSAEITKAGPPVLFTPIKAQMDEQGRLFKQYSEANRAPSREHAAAVRALRVATELYPDAAKVKGLVPVSVMTVEDRGLVATAYMMGLLDGLRNAINTDGLTYVKDAGGYALSAQFSPNHDGRSASKIGLGLMRPMSDGSLFPAMGTGDVAYHGPLPADIRPIPENTMLPLPTK